MMIIRTRGKGSRPTHRPCFSGRWGETLKVWDILLPKDYEKVKSSYALILTLNFYLNKKYFSPTWIQRGTEWPAEGPRN